MAVVVVNEVEFGVVNFRRPLEGLGNVAGGGYVPERSVGIRRADQCHVPADTVTVL